MPKAAKAGHSGKAKIYAVPSVQRRKDIGVPRIQTHKLVGKQAMPYGKSKPVMAAAPAASATFAAMASTSTSPPDATAGPSTPYTYSAPADAAVSTRDSSAKAFMRELRKVVERSDVIIQVLDARDPEGTRSRWVEEEVRKREGEGKKLLAVVNKIDLVPRANLENWLRYLRHSFPCMPFKSSTQSQRAHLSQNSVPLAQPTSTPGQSPSAPSLPTTSSSLGAPALLHLLKQYALSTPHSSLTVGVVGYPNVGKSSLINSLKRSRACGVAAMPGKTRVVQEVVLDKGVKILDCPGVVLEDFGREADGEEGRRRQAEIMLRNCVKAELVEDPVAPVEVILSKIDPLLLQQLYTIPPYEDVRDFLVKIALTRGRLGKGGVPDLEGSAVSVLRDWNSGKIPYFTTPPAVHPSSAPAAASTSAQPTSQDEVMGGEEQVGDAKILTQLSEAFSLEGLFDNVGDGAEWQGVEDDGHVMEQDVDLLDLPPSEPAPASNVSRPITQLASSRPPPPPFAPTISTLITRSAPVSDTAKLFSQEELATLPSGLLDRQKTKYLAKKAKKKRIATERTEGELMLGFMGMGMDEPEPEDAVDLRPTKKERRKVKKVKKAPLHGSTKLVGETEMEVESNDERRKEDEFAKFLANVGAGSDDEL